MEQREREKDQLDRALRRRCLNEQERFPNAAGSLAPLFSLLFGFIFLALTYNTVAQNLHFHVDCYCIVAKSP